MVKSDSEGHALDASRKNDLVGTRFAGKDVIRALDHYGSVFLVQHDLLNRRNVLRFLDNEIAKHPRLTERCRIHARQAATIQHENVVLTINFESHAGRFYYEHEYFPSQSVAEKMKSERLLNLGESLSIIRQACLGLQHAHNLGILHKNLRLSDLWINEAGLVKVYGFGMPVFTYEDLGYTRVASHNPISPYQSPEHLERGSITKQSDIYSLGAACYQILTSRPHFPTNNLSLQWLTHSSENPHSPRFANDEVPTRLANIVVKMLANDQRERYRDLSQVLADLDDVEAVESESFVDQLNAKFDGQYQITEKFDSCLFSHTFRAIPTTNNNASAQPEVVLRVFNPSPNKQQLTELKSQIQKLSLLDSDGIPKILNYSTNTDISYLTTEYYESASTRREKAIGYRPAESDCLRIFRDLLMALKHAHENGVHHGDIRPSNVILDDSGTRLIGFDNIALTPNVSPTPLEEASLYMSPEQCAGDAITERSDLYSLGATLYYFLTNSQPFLTLSIESTLDAHLNTPPKPPNEVNSTISQSTSNLVRNLLAKRPGTRYANVTRVLAELDRLEAGEHIKLRNGIDKQYHWHFNKKKIYFITIAIVCAIASAKYLGAI